MKIVVVKSPKLFGGILRCLFGIKKVSNIDGWNPFITQSARTENVRALCVRFRSFFGRSGCGAAYEVTV